MDGKIVIDYLANDKFAEAKSSLKEIVAANVESRVSAKQEELGLTVEKFEKKAKKCACKNKKDGKCTDCGKEVEVDDKENDGEEDTGRSDYN